ncbi:MAG TPA: SH3 domain-containing protein [Thermodesulfobacteriota bacterium]|nr:SH3 domain-containing protein [Thermodesulfobacteriota bacterium]
MRDRLLLVTTLFFLFGCAAVEPTTKSSSPTRLTYGQILNEDYKGSKARVAVVRFVDKSARDKETSQVGDGMAEMLRYALLATNRYIAQTRRSQDDLNGDQGLGNNGRGNKEKEIDLLVEGEIREFKPSIPGAGDESGGASYVTIIVTMTDPRTKQVLATERVKTKATEFGRTTGRAGGPLPEVFKGFSKTLMEKAIRMTIEESASIVVAKTPPDSYRVAPATVQKETPKSTPVSPKVTPPPPPLRTTQVTWDSVHLREGPGKDHKVIGSVKKGTSLKIIEANGDWLRVRLEDGTTAWVSKSATSEAPKPSRSTPSVIPTPM